MRLTKHIEDDLSTWSVGEVVYLTVLGLLALAMVITLIDTERHQRKPIKHQEQEEY